MHQILTVANPHVGAWRSSRSSMGHVPVHLETHETTVQPKTSSKAWNFSMHHTEAFSITEYRDNYCENDHLKM